MSKVMKAEKIKKLKNSKKFNADEKNEIVKKLVTARIKLLIRHPFFGDLATRLVLIVANDWCPTLATDGRNFYYNEEFVNALSINEAEFCFAHEVLHNVFDHMGRREHRDPLLANIAADFAVNQILVDDRIGKPPHFIKICQDDKYRGESFEEIYTDLYENISKNDIGSLGELLDDHLDDDAQGNGGEGNSEDESGKNIKNNSSRPRFTAEEKEQIRNEIKNAVLSAAQNAGIDKIPASIRQLIKDVTEPKMDWRQILRMNIKSILKNDFSFSRPNRKTQQFGIVLPGMLTQDTIDVCVAVDMSGSISDAQSKDFISEVKGLMEEYTDFKLSLWCFDTSVYNYAQFTGDNASEIDDYEVKGGGGTDFDVNWEFMKQEGIEPKLFIMFTDGYPYNSWGDSEYCDTLFIIHGDETIVSPFGETAYYK
jgi:predicted metal-dependent peptidase